MTFSANSKTAAQWLGSGILGFLLVALMAVVPHAESQSGSTPVTGWMWSDNIGWVSLDCNESTGRTADGRSCGSITYSLTLNNGNVTGYAWSENIGWIKFGGLGPTFPSGGGSATEAAFSSGNFSGWARACAGTTSGDCTNKVGRTDGWDGWISLSGPVLSSTYKVDTDANASYLPQTSGAWGSDVVGWLGAGISSAACVPNIQCNADNTAWTDGCGGGATCTVPAVCQATTGCVFPSPAGCLSIDAEVAFPSSCSNAKAVSRVSGGTKPRLYWDVINVTYCNLSGPGASGTTVSGSTQVTQGVTGSVTYTLSCTDLEGGSVSYKVTASLLPVFEEI